MSPLVMATLRARRTQALLVAAVAGVAVAIALVTVPQRNHGPLPTPCPHVVDGGYYLETVCESGSRAVHRFWLPAAQMSPEILRSVTGCPVPAPELRLRLTPAARAALASAR